GRRRPPAVIISLIFSMINVWASTL
ncbi:ydjC-like family protein, partial [Vibrio cholerae HC-64A1]